MGELEWSRRKELFQRVGIVLSYSGKYIVTGQLDHREATVGVKWAQYPFVAARRRKYST